jgi:K+-sensing histidine kinase KdpD
MATKTAKLTIEKTPVDVDGKLEMRQKLAADLEKKLIDFRAELENKQYLVEGQLTTAEGLHDFITNFAKWSFSESMGIIEAAKQLEVCVKDLKTGKRKELMLPNLTIEAIYYFVSKETGTGLGLNICKAILDEHKFEITAEKLEKGGTKLKIKYA